MRYDTPRRGPLYGSARRCLPAKSSARRKGHRDIPDWRALANSPLERSGERGVASREGVLRVPEVCQALYAALSPLGAFVARLPNLLGALLRLADPTKLQTLALGPWASGRFVWHVSEGLGGVDDLGGSQGPPRRFSRKMGDSTKCPNGNRE